MDEIIIGEKKYISSKQAAKATGYAKDYVGQLCREGRVPARLVGRSWYVLESAIQDHRFGNPINEQVDTEQKVPASESTHLPTWASPRYEALETESLPSVNRLRDEEKPVELVDVKENGSEVVQQTQDAWQAWFDRFEQTVEVSPEVESSETRQEVIGLESGHEKKQGTGESVGDINVPIRTAYEYKQRLPPEALLPRYTPIKTIYNVHNEPMRGRDGYGRIVRAITISSVLLSTIAAITALLGSGYLDTYVISNRQVGIVAGVILYDK